MDAIEHQLSELRERIAFLQLESFRLGYTDTCRDRFELYTGNGNLIPRCIDKLDDIGGELNATPLMKILQGLQFIFKSQVSSKTAR